VLIAIRRIMLFVHSSRTSVPIRLTLFLSRECRRRKRRAEGKLTATVSGEGTEIWFLEGFG
jgi:hypothetical protein